MTLKHNKIHYVAMPSEKRDKEELSKKRILLTLCSKLLQSIVSACIVNIPKKIHRKLKPYMTESK